MTARSEPHFKGPLAESYLSAVALVVLALTPFLALSAAMQPLGREIAKSLGMSTQSLQLTAGMANAAYAFGTVAAVQLAVKLPGRRMLILYASVFVLASVLAAAAWTPAVFIAARITQGLCTSLMLIAAVPPLVTGWPVARTRWTAATMNMCVFGAVALGPVVGGLQAGAKDWRPLFWIVAGVGALALLFAILTFEHQPPQDRSAPWDRVAQSLAGFGCAAAFFGASELQSHALLRPIVLLPLVAGAIMILALVLYEYRAPRPLMPVRSLMSTLPLAGIVVAMCAGAASVAIVELTQTALQASTTPAHAAALFWPEFGGAFVTALFFAAIFQTRFVPMLAFGGLILLCAGAALLAGVTHASDAEIALGTGLVGLGVGASVSPALFVAGFSQRSSQLQRVFALVELLRGVAAFLAAPIIVHLAKTTEPTPAGGIEAGMWVCLGIAAAGALASAYLFASAGVRARPPRLERWLADDGPALDSPPLAARARARHGHPPLAEVRAQGTSPD